MERCQHCYAPYALDALACEYCGTPAPEEKRQKAARARERREAQEAERARQEEERRRVREQQARAQQQPQRVPTPQPPTMNVVDRELHRAFLSALPLVLCCFVRSGPLLWIPLLSSIVTVYFAWSATMMARKSSGGAFFGYLGLAGIIGCLFLWLHDDSEKEKKHIAQLKTRLSAHKDDEVLSRERACDELELYLIESTRTEYGYRHDSEFRCASATIKQTGLEAVLHGARIDTTKHSGAVYACFQRTRSSFNSSEFEWNLRQVSLGQRCAFPSRSR